MDKWSDRENLLDLIVVEEEERNKLLDINIMRGAGGEIPDHHFVIAKIRFMNGGMGE